MQNFFTQQTDWLKSWQENQENLTKQYAGWSKDWMDTVLGKKTQQPEMFDGWFTSQNNLFEQFSEFSRKMTEMLQSTWSGRVPTEVLKLMNLSFFEEFYKHWLSMLEFPGGVKNPLGMDGGWDQVSGFLRSFLMKEHPFFSLFGGTSIVDQLNRVCGMMQGAWGQDQGVYSNILTSYQDLFGKLFESATAQGTEKLAESFEALAKQMEKHLSAPKVGINRELAHDLSRAMVLSQDFVQVYLRMARLVDATSRKSGVRFQAKLSELALQKKPITKFTDFCALWAVENEKVFLDVMGSEEFAKLQGEFVNAGHRLKIQFNTLAEKALEQTPIALKRDLDLAIAEIQQLKRGMRSFQREMKDVVSELREANAKAEGALKKATASAVAAQDEVKKAKAAGKAAETAAQEEVKRLRSAVKVAETEAKEQTKKTRVAEAALEKLSRKASAAGTTEQAVTAPAATTTNTNA